MIISLCDIISMKNHRYYNTKHALKFCPSFKLYKSCPLSKVMHVYQSFLKHNLKALSYWSMEQLPMPCVKQQGEGFCYADCNISRFSQNKSSWNRRWAFWNCSISYGTYVRGFTTKKYLVSSGNIRDRWVVEIKTWFWHFTWQIDTQFVTDNSRQLPVCLINHL